MGAGPGSLRECAPGCRNMYLPTYTLIHYTYTWYTLCYLEVTDYAKDDKTQRWGYEINCVNHLRIARYK